MQLGTHISLSDEEQMLERIRKHKIPVVQVFVGPPQKASVRSGEIDWTAVPFPVRIFVHGPYIINPASEHESKRNAAIGIMKRLAKAAHEIGAAALVIHPGSSKEGDKLDIISRLLEVAAAVPMRILYETDSGSKAGSKVGSLQLLDKVREQSGGEVGLCIDTAHVYAAGVDPSPSLIKTYAPDLIHLNDPDKNVEMGGHLDRHSVILGQGKMGLGKLVSVAKQGVQQEIPMVVEQGWPLSIKSVALIRSRVEQAAPSQWIAKLRIQPVPDVGDLCALCGRNGVTSKHHVIPLQFWGTNMRANIMPVHMTRDEVCPGHFFANVKSREWCRKNLLKFYYWSMEDLAKACWEYIIASVKD